MHARINSDFVTSLSAATFRISSFKSESSLNVSFASSFGAAIPSPRGQFSQSVIENPCYEVQPPGTMNAAGRHTPVLRPGFWGSYFVNPVSRYCVYVPVASLVLGGEYRSLNDTWPLVAATMRKAISLRGVRFLSLY